MRSSMALTLTFVALMVGRSSAAQQLTPGTKVRFTAPSVFEGWRIGNVTGFVGDSMRVAYSTGDTAAIPISKIQLMDESRGKHAPLWAKLSGLVTVPLGAGGGLITGVIASTAEPHDDDEAVLRWTTGVGAAAGLVTGIVLATSYRAEVWAPVRLPGARWYQPASVSGLIPAARPTSLRLELRVAGRTIDGTFVEQRGDTIELAKNAVHTNIPIALISEVRVSRGKSRLAGARFGALWGFGIGVLESALVVSGPNDSNDVRNSGCDPNETDCEYESDLATAAPYMVGYALIGAAIGAAIGRERWDRASLPTPNDEPARRLLLVPRRDGIWIGVHATF